MKFNFLYIFVVLLVVSCKPHFYSTNSVINELKSFDLEKLNSINGIVSQYDNFNPAASIVSKAIQPADFFPTSVVDHISTAMTVQDNFLEMIKRVSVYDNSLISVRDDLIQHIERANIHSNMISSVNVIRSSLEPHISALDAVNTSFEASESLKRVRGLQSYIDSSNSLLSEYTGVFKKFESLHNLESFKAITRLKNFPFEDMARIDLDSTPDLEENLSETIVELDSEISDEISLVDDFNELSEEKRTVLLGLYQVYYYPIILNCLFILMWLQVFLDEKLDLTKNSFIFVERSKEKLSYISNVYRPNPSAMIDNLVVGGFLMLLAKYLGW